ncbi:GGDEF domain-containing protein [Bacillus sp. 2205SS5-2]|uniref:GGDEF domain-containing protein n=1 Tax=Bacillus sp. 2205SS5-2 TaxID=3109031 RepID=UPI0030077684
MEHHMLQIFFLKICVIIFFIFVAGAMMRNQKMKKNGRISWLVGGIAGLVGWELVQLSALFDQTSITDLRHLIVVILATYFGPTAPVLGAVLLATGNIVFFSLNMATLWWSGMILFLGLVFALLSKWKINRIWKFTLFCILSESVIILSFLWSPEFSSVSFSLFLARFAFFIIAGILFFLIAEYIKRNNDLYHVKIIESITDHLTGLQNRRSLDEEISRITTSINQGDATIYSVLLFDIDHFKKLNDSYGHICGDGVLIQLSQLVNEYTEDMQNASLFRYGGEEFCLIVEECYHKEVIALAENIRKIVESTKFQLTPLTSISISISIGVASYPESMDEVDGVIQKADEHLYVAKGQGRNCVVDHCVVREGLLKTV